MSISFYHYFQFIQLKVRINFILELVRDQRAVSSPSVKSTGAHPRPPRDV